MKKFVKFLTLEIILFSIITLITFLEIFYFKIFEFFFILIKNPSSWFVGFGLAYAFSNLFQKKLFKLFSKRAKDEEKKKGDFFIGFLITIVLTSLITGFIKKGAEYLLTNFFIYFHVIIMQCLIVLYILFKLKENFEISGKYLLANEIIVLVNTLLILQFVAS